MLILAYVHRQTARVLFTRRIIVAVKAAVIARYVHIAAGAVNLVLWLKSIVSFFNACC